MLASIILVTSQQQKIEDYQNINSVNSLYLIIGKADGYIKENYGNKYFVFTSTDANKKLLTKFRKLWDEIEHLNETINEVKKGKFNSDDNLPLNKMLKLHMLTVIVRSIFEEDGEYYPQVFLDECLCEV